MVKHQLSVKHRVVNYKNDAETRAFFVSQIGSQFRFNEYLRQFSSKEKIKPGMTYGDLVDGWIQSEANKKQFPTKISKQFEYNRFIRDYFENEKDSSLANAIKAWKFIKSRPGPNTYEQYQKDLSNQ